MRRWPWLLLLLVLAGASLGAFWWSQAKDPDVRLRRAQAALTTGDRATFERELAWLEAAEYADHVHLLRGEALVHAGDFEAALAQLNQVRDEGEVRLRALALSGQCLLQLGNPLEAQRAFGFLLGERPDDLDAHRGLAAAAYDLSSFAQAVAHAERWATLAPEDGRPERLIGLIQKDLGQHEAAVRAYRAALGRTLKDRVQAEVREELAECLIKLGSFKEALGVLDAAIPPEDAVARVLTLKADCRRQLAEPAVAHALVAQALELEPSNPAALRVRGRLLLEAGDPAKAVLTLEDAVRFAPHDYETQHQLSQAYAQAGDAGKANAARDRVLAMRADMDELTKLTRTVMEQPRDASLHRRMAELYERLHMPEMAAKSRRIASLVSKEPRTE